MLMENIEVFPLPVSVNEQRIGGNMTTYFPLTFEESTTNVNIL